MLQNRARDFEGLKKWVHTSEVGKIYEQGYSIRAAYGGAVSSVNIMSSVHRQRQVLVINDMINSCHTSVGSIASLNINLRYKD